MRVTRLILALIVASASRAESPEPYRLSLALDAPLLGGSVALFVGARIAKSHMDGPDCHPCDPDDLNALDRRALGYDSDGARVASDVVRNTVFYGALALDLVDIATTRRRLAWSEAAADLTVLSEVFLFNDGLTSLVKFAAHRPRPEAYRSDVDLDIRERPRSAQSFYSGHASLAFAMGTAATITYWRRHRTHPSRWIVAGASLVLASATAALRVLAGLHFPTDVAVGAVAGTAVGAAVPWLHEQGARAGPGLVSWRF